MTTEQEATTIVVEPLARKMLTVKIKGVEGSSLISHRLSSESMSQITAKETGTARKKKLRNFDEEYQRCFYKLPTGGYGFPSAAFMNSMLDAAVSVNIPKTQIKRAVRVLGDILPLKYERLNRRIDFPRRSGITAAPDERHRPEFIGWSTELLIEYDSNQISPDMIINLINQSGFTSGVGDWRPSSPKSSGTHGMFMVIGGKQNGKKV